MRPSFRALVFMQCAYFASSAALAQAVLLIPDSDTDSVGMYDAQNGNYLSDLIHTTPRLNRPICATLGPDGLIYVSDQLMDSVLRFDQSGTFVDEFCGPSDGLDNVRGIAFQGSDLLVCYASTVVMADRGVARFSANGTRLANVVTGLVDPFDVYVEGTDILVSDITGDRVVRFVNGAGAGNPLFSVDFPEQITKKTTSSNLLNIAYNANVITEFGLDSGVVSVTPITGLGRGIAELGNGHYLITTAASISEIHPLNGTQIRVVRTGGGFRLIERVTLGPIGCTNQTCAAADLDGTCEIDLVDLTLFLAAFGNTGSPGTVFGDTNGDGAVDLADLTTVLALFGSNCNQ